MPAVDKGRGRGLSRDDIVVVVIAGGLHNINNHNINNH